MVQLIRKAHITIFEKGMLKQFYNIFTARVLNQVGIKNRAVNIIDYAENEIP